MKKIYVVTWTYETAFKNCDEPDYRKESHIAAAFTNRKDAIEFVKQEAKLNVANMKQQLEDGEYEWKFNEWTDSKIEEIIIPTSDVWMYLEYEDDYTESWHTLTIDETFLR